MSVFAATLAHNPLGVPEGPRVRVGVRFPGRQPVRTMPPTSRIRQIASHVVAAVEAEAEEELHIDEYIARHGHTQQQRGNRGPEQAEFTKRLKEMPRVDKDIATWSNAELMRRGLALGASDEQISDIVASTDSRAELLALVSSLEPPPPSTATVDQITVDARTATIEEMGEILERVGAVVITNAAPLELMDALDAQLEEAGAWNISRGKQVNGRPAGRMQMNMLLKAPLTQELVTNEYVTGVTRHVLGPHCKRIALKELSGECCHARATPRRHIFLAAALPNPSWQIVN